MVRQPKIEEIADSQYKCRRCGEIFVFKDGDTEGVGTINMGYALNLFYATQEEQAACRRDIIGDQVDGEGKEKAKVLINRILGMPSNTRLHDCPDGSKGVSDLVGLVNLRTVEIYKVGRGSTRKLKETQ